MMLCYDCQEYWETTKAMSCILYCTRTRFLYQQISVVQLKKRAPASLLVTQRLHIVLTVIIVQKLNLSVGRSDSEGAERGCVRHLISPSLVQFT